MPKKAATDGKRPGSDNGSERPFGNAAAIRESRVNRILSSAEMFNRIKGYGREWDAETEKLISPPPNLYENSGGATQYFSRDISFGISSVVFGFIHGAHPEPKKNDYGVALYEKTGTLYFVLLDMSRKIIVKERILSYQHDPPQQSWANVREAIRYALSAAKTAKQDEVIVFDGTARVEKIEAPSDSWRPVMPHAPKKER